MNRTHATVVCALLLSCSNDAQRQQPPPGAEGGECEHHDTCDDGLVCASGLCVRPPAADATGDPSDSAAAAPDAGPDVETDVETEPDVTDRPDVPPDLGPDSASADVAGGGEDPTCMIATPEDGSTHTYFAELSFTATATDAEDGALPDDAISWSSDLLGPLGTGKEVVAALPRGGTHVIRCTVVDSDGNEGFSEVTVNILSPIARIFHPSDGETRTAGSMVPFVGRGDDAEDGALTGASLVWTSNIDGPLGTGETFRAPLSAGMNVVTLTVTDADGNSADISITLDMVP